MRRPRGPGGRFLTAEEIAAQKTAQGDMIDPALSPGNHHEDDHDQEDVHEPDQPPHIPFDDRQPLSRDSYQDAGSLANALSHSTTTQPQQVQYATNSPTGNNPINLHSPYSPLQQMQSRTSAGSHVPYANGLYHNPESVGTVNESEMRRRTEEMIHFSGGGS